MYEMYYNATVLTLGYSDSVIIKTLQSENW